MNDLFEEDEFPSKLEMATGLFVRQAESHYVGVVVPITVRLPVFTYGYVESLTRHTPTGVSRNRVVCELLAVGIEAVLGNLPKADRDAVEAHFQEVVGAMSSDAPDVDQEGV